MIYRGHITNGQIMLDEPAELPEGAVVAVEVMERGRSAPNRREILRLPVEQRRQLLIQQSQRLAGHYESDGDRPEWQGGDILE